jgi:hypothetical protein
LLNKPLSQTVQVSVLQRILIVSLSSLTERPILLSFALPALGKATAFSFLLPENGAKDR